MKSRFIAVPKSFKIDFRGEDGRAVSGRFRETYTNWLFPGSVVTGAISREMEFQRRWINTFYYVEVKPDLEVTAHVR